VTRFESRSKRLGLGPMSVSFNRYFCREEGELVMWAIARGCDSRAVVVAVSYTSQFITVMDAATGDKLSESPPISCEEEEVFLACVAASQVGGRTLMPPATATGLFGLDRPSRAS
jgi:hypothetical protein